MHPPSLLLYNSNMQNAEKESHDRIVVALRFVLLAEHGL